MKLNRLVYAVVGDTQRVGRCNGCDTDDRRVAICQVGRFEVRLCSECATKLVNELRAIPAFVKESPHGRKD